MLTNIPADAHKREMLYQHDVGVARMRRMLTQQVKSQLEAEACAVGPRLRFERRCLPGAPSS